MLDALAEKSVLLPTLQGSDPWGALKNTETQRSAFPEGTHRQWGNIQVNSEEKGK